MLPRMVSGPTQNSRDAVSHPSMNRSRAAWASPGLLGVRRAHAAGPRGSWIAPGEPGQPLLDPQQRADDAADEQASRGR